MKAFFLLIGMLSAAALVVRAEEASKPPKTAEAISDQLWALMDAVLDKDMIPPTRQEMCLGAARALVGYDGKQNLAELSRRASQITTREQFTALIKSLWSQQHADVYATMAQGVMGRVSSENRWLGADVVRSAKAFNGNRYVGTGIQLGYNREEKLPQIINPFRHGPMRRAGGRPGDLVLAVDGKSTAKASLKQTVEWLRGEEGTNVDVLVRHPSSEEQRTLHMKREVIPFDSVFGCHRLSEEAWSYLADAEKGVGYVWLSGLRSSTVHELRQAEARMKAEGVRAVVIDLRFCTPGDTEHFSALVADSLVGTGRTLWRTRDAQGQVQERKAGGDLLFAGLPMAVIIDEESVAGPVAAIAAALKDNGRAMLIGTGPEAHVVYVTSMIDLPSGEALLLRTGQIERIKASWPLVADRAATLKAPQRAAVEKWLHEKELSELPSGGTDDKPPEDSQLSKALAAMRESLKTTGTAKR
jgi:C-terminal peptidase prc